MRYFKGFDQKIYEILQELESESTNISQVVFGFNQINKLELDNKIQDDQKIKEKEQIQQGLDLHKVVKKIIQITYQEKDYNLRKGMMFQIESFLLTMKNRETKNYNQLYVYKEKLDKKINIEKNEIKQLFNTLKGFDEDVYEEIQNIEQQDFKLNDFIKKCLKYYEEFIQVKIFSKELLWREMIYYTQIGSKNHVLKYDNEIIPLKDFLIEFQKSRVQEGSAFEVIDGDNLKISVDFIRKIMPNMNEKENVGVISVLGPQSSGKSTLLNFLFGCDFASSSGRCTKGIYGTFLKLSNYNSLGGIFILDTEGLFGLLDENESQKRKQFDKKLVTFCLAVSDVVLINFRGDVDNNLSEILKMSKVTIEKLQQGSEHKTEMFMVLNQNSQTSMETHLKDIEQLEKIGIKKDNVQILGLAYSQESFELSEKSSFSIRKSTKQFNDQCNNLSQKIFDKLSAADNRNLAQTIQTIEKMWATINQFPCLIQQRKTLEEQEFDDNMNRDIQKEIKYCRDQMDLFYEETSNKFKQQKKIDPLITDKFEELSKIILEKLQQLIKNKWNHENKQIIQDNMNFLIKQFDINKNEVSNKIKQLYQEFIMESQNLKGHEKFNILINEIRRDQNLSNEQKKQKFEELYDKIEKEIESKLNRNVDSNYLLKQIRDQFNLILKDGTGLPDIQLDQNLQTEMESYKRQLKKHFLKSKYDFDQTQTTPAFILDIKECDTNIKFQYLNLKDCFEEKSQQELFIIFKENVIDNLNLDIIRQQYNDSQVEQSLKNDISDKIIQSLQFVGLQAQKEYILKYLENKIKKQNYAPYQQDFQFISNNQHKQTQQIQQPLEFINDLFTVSQQDIQSIFKNDTPYNATKDILQNCVNWKQIKYQYYIDSYEQDCQKLVNSLKMLKIQANENYVLDFIYYKKSILQQIWVKEPQQINFMQISDSEFEQLQYENKNQNSKQSNIQDHSIHTKQFHDDLFKKDPKSKKNLTQLEFKNCSPQFYTQLIMSQMINWDKIVQNIQETKMFYFEQNILKQIDLDIQNELEQLNLKCNQNHLKKYIQVNLCDQQNTFKVKQDLEKSLQIISQNPRKIESKEDLRNLHQFKYLKMSQILYYIQPRPSPLQNIELRVAQKNSKQKVLKDEFKHIKWLEYYYEHSIQELLSYKNSQDLMNFVKQTFKMENLIDKIFEDCHKILKESNKDWTNDQIYKNIYQKGIMCHLADADDDLTQVSKKIDVATKGNIMNSIAYCVWKYFEIISWEKSQKPLLKFREEKAKLFKYFIAQTSNDEKEQNQSEVNRFLEQLNECCAKSLKQFTNNRIDDLSQNFAKIVTRKSVQQEIDLEYLSENSVKTDDQIFNYLRNPVQVVSEKYQEKKNDQFNKFKLNFQKEQDEIKRQFQYLKASIDSVNKQIKHLEVDQFSLNSFYDVQSTDLQKDFYLQKEKELKQLNFKIFIDMLNGKKIKNIQQIDNKNIVSIKVQLELVENKYIFSKIMNDSIKLIGISNLMIFFDYLQTEIQKVDIENLIKYTEQDKDKFINNINYMICDKLCPCCYRICGQEGVHDIHKVNYGHQPRAFAGSILSNNNASIMSCEQIDDTDIINFNGNELTYAQFREQMKQQGTKWDFDDTLNQNNNDKFEKNFERFSYIWNKYGQRFCDQVYKDKNMKFWECSKKNIQTGRIVHQKGPYKYIFVYDSSGSMQGSPWQEVLDSMKQALGDIRKQHRKNTVTLINFSSHAITEGQDLDPNSVSVNNLRFQGDQTDFCEALNEVIKFVQSDTQAIYQVIFLSDGGASIPLKQIQQINDLFQGNRKYFNLRTKKFNFYGIEFGDASPTLQQMTNMLGGKSKITDIGAGELSQVIHEIVNMQNF